MDFKAGDVVQLKSGGPKMTVKGIAGKEDGGLTKVEISSLKIAQTPDGHVWCVWFDEKNVQKSGMFSPILLKLIE